MSGFALGRRMIGFQGPIPYRSGQKGAPLQLERNGFLAQLLLHIFGTMTITQPATTPPAPTLQAGGPWNLISSLGLQVGGLGWINNLSGYGLMVHEAYRHPGYAPQYTAPLPGAGGAAIVVTPEAWDFRLALNVAVDERDLVGMINLQNAAASAYLQCTFASEATVISLPNGTTAAFNPGAINVDAISFEPPSGKDAAAIDAAVLGTVHTLEEIPTVLSGGAKTRIQLPVGDIYQAIYLTTWTAAGNPDTANTIGLASIDLNYGNYHPVNNVSAAAVQFLSAMTDRSDAPANAYVLDFMKNRPYEYVDATDLPQLNLDLTFNAAPPAGAQVNVLLERLRAA